MTIETSFRQFTKALSTIYPEREATNIAKIVFEDAFKIYSFQSVKNFLFQKELKQIESRLLKNEPVQYVLGEADFYGLKFKVNPNVLIPRPETEELVYWVLGNKLQKEARILDIGTGSGCIPITLKKKLPFANISAIDVSQSALEIAKINALKNEVEINFSLVDILNKKDWTTLPQFDIIISNPPYIPHQEKVVMPKNVLDFEPTLALFVENDNPLLFYETIGLFAQKHLTENGLLFFECNEFNAPKVVNLLKKQGYQTVDLEKDMEGKERMIRAE